MIAPYAGLAPYREQYENHRKRQPNARNNVRLAPLIPLIHTTGAPMEPSSEGQLPSGTIPPIDADRKMFLYRQLVEMVAVRLQQHGATLLRKRQMLHSRDDYGNVLTEKWESEMKYFVSSVLLQDSVLDALFDRCFDCHSLDDKEYLYAEQIDGYLNELTAQQFDDSDNSLLNAIEHANPAEFELLCGALLSRHGWKVIPVGGTGDHGADLIGERAGVRVAFQCKKYGTPVGNFAVQEVLAGKVMHRADFAAVIATRGYTSAARELANAANVHLIGVTDLPNFHAFLELE